MESLSQCHGDNGISIIATATIVYHKQIMSIQRFENAVRNSFNICNYKYTKIVQKQAKQLFDEQFTKRV